jgi:hypothetical protein
MQQLFSFIYFFKSALHISGDKFTHPHEHFLTVYTALGTTHRLVVRLKWNSVTSKNFGSHSNYLIIQQLVSPVDSGLN